MTASRRSKQMTGDMASTSKERKRRPPGGPDFATRDYRRKASDEPTTIVANHT